KLLLGAGSEALFADDLAAFVVLDRGNNRLGGSGGTDACQDCDRTVKDYLRGIGSVGVRDLISLPDNGREIAVLDKQIGHCHPLGQAARRYIAEVENDLLSTLLLERLDLILDVGGLAVLEAVNLDDADLAVLHAALGRGSLVRAANDLDRLRLFAG